MIIKLRMKLGVNSLPIQVKLPVTPGGMQFDIFMFHLRQSDNHHKWLFIYNFTHHEILQLSMLVPYSLATFGSDQMF